MNRAAYPFILSSSLMLMACGGATDDATTTASLPNQLAGQQQVNAPAALATSSTAGTAQTQADAESPAMSVAANTLPAPASVAGVSSPTIVLPIANATPPVTATPPVATPAAPVIIATAPPVTKPPVTTPPVTPPPVTPPPVTPPPVTTPPVIAPPVTTVPGPTIPVSTVLSAEQTCNQPDFQRTIMNLINQARAGSRVCGSTSYPAVAPLTWNAKLFNAGAAHSADMARNNYFSHTSQDGRTVGQRITNAGYTWSTYGENIAMGQSSANSVMDSWMKSSGHCVNIMSARLTEVAVACVKNSSSRNYWTMVLARPR